MLFNFKNKCHSQKIVYFWPAARNNAVQTSVGLCGSGSQK